MWTVYPNTCRFRVCEFTYSLKFICSLRIITCGAFKSFTHTCRAVKSLSHPIYMIPTKVKQGTASCLSQPHDEVPRGWRWRVVQCCASLTQWPWDPRAVLLPQGNAGTSRLRGLACLSSGAQRWFIRGVGRNLQRPGSFSIFCTPGSDKIRPQSPREQIVKDLQGIVSFRDLAHERPELLTWAGEVGTNVLILHQAG